jgi:3-phenylpropionate/trans-cinnamate dioxygenase ferredoxin component
MAEFVDIAAVNDLPVGRTRTIAVGDRKIALCRTPKGFFALDNTCAHRGGPLGEGDLIGDELICPWHLWGFDVATGTCLGNPEVSVLTHEVKVEGDRVLVRLAARREIPEPL